MAFQLEFNNSHCIKKVASHVGRQQIELYASWKCSELSCTVRFLSQRGSEFNYRSVAKGVASFYTLITTKRASDQAAKH